jgi:cyclopropane fatty-acyl-phospholipid synthase-like methyltransferase
MTYDPLAYWSRAGSDPTMPDHEANFVRTDVFAEQERRLIAALEGLDFRSILEVGCGFGRITKLVSERWPDATYTAIDLSPERLESAARKAPGVEFVEATVQGYKTRRKWDLVLAVEMLMHVPEDEVAAVVERLCGLSRRWVVSLDWSEPIAGEIAPWNALFDYPALYGERLVRAERVGPLQSLYVVDVRP